MIQTKCKIAKNKQLNFTQFGKTNNIIMEKTRETNIMLRNISMN